MANRAGGVSTTARSSVFSLHNSIKFVVFWASQAALTLFMDDEFHIFRYSSIPGIPANSSLQTCSQRIPKAFSVRILRFNQG